MHTSSEAGVIPVVLILCADKGRSEQFQADCSAKAKQLHFAATLDDARTLLIQKHISLLVIDLEGFSRSDVKQIGELINHRPGMDTLALCPAVEADWLLKLMPLGLVHYCLTPCAPAELTRRLADMALKVEAFDMKQRLDDLGDIVDLNDSWLDDMGYRIDEVIGTQFIQYVDKKSRAAVERAMKTTSSNPTIDSVVIQLRRKDGTSLDVSLTGQAIYNAHGEHLQTRCDLRGVNYFLEDKRKSQSTLEVERELKVLLQVRAKLQQALMGIKDVNELSFLMCHELRKCPGIVGVAFLHCDQQGMRLDACMSRDDEHRNTFTKGCELALQTDKGDDHSFLKALSKGEFVIADSLSKVTGQSDNRFFRAIGVRTIVGTPILEESFMFDESAKTLGALCLMLDRRRNFPREWLDALAELGMLASFGLRIIEWGHEKADLMRQLHDMAMKDTLTGAANRRMANEFMEHEYEASLANNTPITMLMMDIDKFKSINDNYGHSRGDEVLKAVTRIAKIHLRAQDLLVRWGGEEFLVVAPNTDAQAGFELAEAIRCEVEKTALEDCKSVTISLGVSQVEPGERIESALARADAALYIAKNSGRNRSKLAEPA
jgi:diguanylate cyclase (GGDEF)-like protein/PAS domain S-box-containing protein